MYLSLDQLSEILSFFTAHLTLSPSTPVCRGAVVKKHLRESLIVFTQTQKTVVKGQHSNAEAFSAAGPCIPLSSLFLLSSLPVQCTGDINLRTNPPLRNCHQKFFRSSFLHPFS